MSVAKDLIFEQTARDELEIMLLELQPKYEQEQLSKSEMGLITNIKATLDLGEDVTDEQIMKLREVHEDNVEPWEHWDSNLRDED